MYSTAPCSVSTRTSEGRRSHTRTGWAVVSVFSLTQDSVNRTVSQRHGEDRHSAAKDSWDTVDRAGLLCQGAIMGPVYEPVLHTGRRS